MLDLYDSHLQFMINKLDHKSTGSCLKLVVSNPPIKQTIPPSYEDNANTGFSSNVRRRGPNLFSLFALDPSHCLECELTLETQEREDENNPEPSEVICHFPNISDEKLNDYVWKDETLLGMILIQFQMKVIRQLLTFCANQHASNLVVYTDDARSESLGIYREFLFTEGYFIPETESNPEIIIPTNSQAIEKWDNYMNKVNIQLHQTLWREQSLNPAIRQYLKTHPLG